MLVEKKKETITESAGRQQKKKIGKNPVNKPVFCFYDQPFSSG